jgi:hypothetical protein
LLVLFPTRRGDAKFPGNFDATSPGAARSAPPSSAVTKKTSLVDSPRRPRAVWKARPSLDGCPV